MSSLSSGVALTREGECERGADGVVGGGLGETRFLGESLSVGFFKTVLTLLLILNPRQMELFC